MTRDSGEQGLCEFLKILRPLSKRWHEKLYDSETVEQIASEPPFGNILGQISVGGGDDPHVDATLAVFADPANFTLLEDAKQLDLVGVSLKIARPPSLNHS